MVHELDEAREELGVLAPVLADEEPVWIQSVLVLDKVAQELVAVVLDGVETHAAQL